MKQFIIKLFKNIILQLLSLSILIWLVAFATISWPTWTPTWETAWWTFQANFNKIFNAITFNWTNIDVSWKIKSSSTVSSDAANTVVTKDYVDTKTNWLATTSYVDSKVGNNCTNTIQIPTTVQINWAWWRKNTGNHIADTCWWKWGNFICPVMISDYFCLDRELIGGVGIRYRNRLVTCKTTLKTVCLK